MSNRYFLQLPVYEHFFVPIPEVKGNVGEGAKEEEAGHQNSV